MRYSNVFICNRENRHLAVNRFNGSGRIFWQLIEWFDTYYEEDMNKLEDDGFTREMFQNLYDKTQELNNLTFVPLSKSNPSFQRIAALFYKDKVDSIKKAVDDLQQVYDECDSNKKNNEFIVIRDLKGFKIEEDILRILNPFNLVLQAVQEGRTLINEIEVNSKDIEMDLFIFTDKFNILSTFITDIQNKGLNNDEIQELKNDWSLLMIKGFTLWQVKNKLTDDDLALLKRDNEANYFCRREGSTDQSYQDYSEIKNLTSNLYLLYTESGEINFDKLNQIYQSHSSDEAGQALKPFVEELIPYYQSLMKPEMLFKLTFEFSEKYQPLFQDKTMKYVVGNAIPNNFYYFPLYFEFTPFKLIDSPGKTYDEIFVICMKNNFNYWHDRLYSNLYYTRKMELPKLEKVEEYDTLQKQKYYIVWYLIDFAAKGQIEAIGMQDSCLLLSLLDWKFEADCQEARTFENYMKTYISNILNHYNYADTRFNDFPHFAKFIISTVNKAQEPLDQNELKSKLDGFTKSAVAGEAAAGGCCTIQ